MRPPIHRRRRSPYTRQVLGVRVNSPIVVVGHALHVLREIHAENYRWIRGKGWNLHTAHSRKFTPVGNTVVRLIDGGFLKRVDELTLEVTLAGLSELERA